MVEIEKMAVSGQAGQKKFMRPHCLWAQWHMPVTPATSGSLNRRIIVQARLGKQ
jgi:hypothetical protein